MTRSVMVAIGLPIAFGCTPDATEGDEGRTAIQPTQPPPSKNSQTKPNQREYSEFTRSQAIRRKLYVGMTLIKAQEVFGFKGNMSRGIGKGSKRTEVYEWRINDNATIECTFRGGALTEISD